MPDFVAPPFDSLSKTSFSRSLFRQKKNTGRTRVFLLLGAVVEEVRTVFEERDDVTICIPSL